MFRSLCVSMLAWLLLCPATIFAQNPEGQWWSGVGENLKLRLSGEVVDEGGQPAQNFGMNVSVKTVSGDIQKIDVEPQGSRFEFWLPVGELNFPNVFIEAVSEDHKSLAIETISRSALHEFAQRPMRLKFVPIDRRITVKVTLDGKPVPHAMVWPQWSYRGGTATYRADDQGQVTLAARDSDTLSNLNAWSESDGKRYVGGYSMHRQPSQDPAGNDFTIELIHCKPMPVRLLNSDTRKPVPDVEFEFTVNTGEPHYNFPAQTPFNKLKTNAQGEAIYEWFPEIEGYDGYIELANPNWVFADHNDFAKDHAEFWIKPSQFKNRQLISGAVLPLANAKDMDLTGVMVEARSFQGESEHRSDMLFAYTDAQGNFEFNILPGATYCLFVDDSKLVSETIDMMLFDPATNKALSPKLRLVDAQPIEIAVTIGPDHSPMANQGVNVRFEYNYTWLEGGRTQHGGSGRQAWGLTDEKGSLVVYGEAGKDVEVSVYTSSWQLKEKKKVALIGTTSFTLHRALAGKLRIEGKVSIEDGSTPLAGPCTLEICSFGADSDEKQTIRTDAQGKFEFQTVCSSIGLFASTADRQFTLAQKLEDLGKASQPLELKLSKAASLKGQVRADGKPLRDHELIAYVELERPHDALFHFRNIATLSARTNHEGEFEFRVPTQCKVRLYCKPKDKSSEHNTHLQDLYIEPGESRPPMSFDLDEDRPAKAKLSMEQRAAAVLRDCRLNGYHLLVIVAPSGDKEAQQFIGENLMESDKVKEAYTYMQWSFDTDRLNAVDQQFFESKKWPKQSAGRVEVCALNGDGTELERLSLDITKKEEALTAAEQFIKRNAVSKLDAQKKWDAAFAEAKKSNRKVWMRISQRYCGPCFTMSRWLDDRAHLLERDYVMLKVDDYYDEKGLDVAQKLLQGRYQGIPFHGIFDSSGKLIIDSYSPIGNIGSPSSDFDTARHVRKMLNATREKLTEADVEQILSSTR